MKCGCAKTDAAECAAQMYHDDRAAYLMLWHTYDKNDRCSCDCHDGHTRRAHRLKLKPEKNQVNPAISSDTN